MTQEQINELALANQEKASQVLAESRIAETWRDGGCLVNLVGSLRMGLLMKHRDIDLHVYSSGITPEASFAVASRIAANPKVTEIRCVNGLHTDEHCISWQFFYRDDDDDLWQFDVIHIEAGSEYDGYFERMADRIKEIMTPEQKDLILRLKYETSEGKDYHRVEYYEAVIADGIKDMASFKAWVADHRTKAPHYWIP